MGKAIFPRARVSEQPELDEPLKLVSARLSVLDPDRDPGVGLRVPAPRQTLDGELVAARAECGAVEGDAQVAVRILAEIVDDRDATLIDAVDRHAIFLVWRVRH